MSDFRLTFHHTTLVVRDFARSKRFYTEVLGLDMLDADGITDTQMFVAVGQNLELHIGEVPGVDIQPMDFNHLALSVDDFEGFLQHLKEQGVVYSSLGGGDDYVVHERPDGMKQTFVQDPDGYWIEFNSGPPELADG